jgi:hypothetical protein
MNEKEKIEKEFKEECEACETADDSPFTCLTCCKRKLIKEHQAKKELVDIIEKMIIGQAEYSEVYNLINKYKEK